MDTPQATAATTIRAYFAKLGLAPEVADIYLALHSHGPQTLSALSRTSGVERTRIYRLMDDLIHSNLVEADTAGYKAGLIKAAPIANLHILITRRQQEAQALQEELGLIEQVLARNQLSAPGYRVQTYTGVAGWQQMLWNILEATTPVLAYQAWPYQDTLGSAFMRHWRTAAIEKSLKRDVIIGDYFRHHGQDNEAETSPIRGTTYNYLSPNQFPITHTCEVYNDVVAYFSLVDGEPAGLEVYNHAVADTQRLFIRRLIP